MIDKEEEQKVSKNSNLPLFGILSVIVFQTDLFFELGLLCFAFCPSSLSYSLALFLSTASFRSLNPSLRPYWPPAFNPYWPDNPNKRHTLTWTRPWNIRKLLISQIRFHYIRMCTFESERYSQKSVMYLMKRNHKCLTCASKAESRRFPSYNTEIKNIRRRKRKNHRERFA